MDELEAYNKLSHKPMTVREIHQAGYEAGKKYQFRSSHIFAEAEAKKFMKRIIELENKNKALKQIVDAIPKGIK